ncbi:hypothetical protein GCM10027596_31580 [Nocardioides korecus]
MTGSSPSRVSGQRTHHTVKGSKLVVIAGACHGCNVSHANDLNNALIGFLDS